MFTAVRDFANQNRHTSGSIFPTSPRQRSNSPPQEGLSVNFPTPRAQKVVKRPMFAQRRRGGDVEVSIWSSHYNNIIHIDDDDMVTIKLWLDVSIHSLWPYNVLVSKQSCIVIGDAVPRICNIGVKEQEWNRKTP